MVAGLFVWAVAVWASPDVICRDLALAGLTSDICFPTMRPLYFEARWQMMPPKQMTHTKQTRTRLDAHIHSGHNQLSLHSAERWKQNYGTICHPK